MFLQHAIDAQTLRFDPAHAEALLRSHPLLLTALVEGYWRNRIGPHSPFAAWPQKMIGRIEEEFDSPLGVQPEPTGTT